MGSGGRCDTQKRSRFSHGEMKTGTTEMDACAVLGLRLEMATIGRTGWQWSPNPHRNHIVMEPLATLQAGDVGISGLRTRLMLWRRGPRDRLVAATEKGIQNPADHALR